MNEIERLPGKTDKGLSERISASAMMFMGVVAALSAKEAP